MKKPSFAYSIRLDEKVILFMMIVSIAGLALTAFRYKNSKPCSDFRFSVYANYFHVSRAIFFKTSDTRHAEKWVWDFGDKSGIDRTSGPIASHVYHQPGRYTVTLTIDDQCSQSQTFIIDKIAKDAMRIVTPQVIWPAEPVMVGQNVLFRDITNGASRWEWYIGEGKTSKRFTTQNVEFTFTQPGQVPVKLFVNGDPEARQERIIKVQNAPEPKRLNASYKNGFGRRRPNLNIKDRPDGEPLFVQEQEQRVETSKPHAPLLTRDVLLQMIGGVISKTVTEADFQPYLCGNSNVRVSLNGDDMGFSECIQQLQKLKKVKSLKASAYTDSETNCILSISIVYKKKTFLGL